MSPLPASRARASRGVLPLVDDLVGNGFPLFLLLLSRTSSELLLLVELLLRLTRVLELMLLLVLNLLLRMHRLHWQVHYMAFAMSDEPGMEVKRVPCEVGWRQMTFTRHGSNNPYVFAWPQTTNVLDHKPTYPRW